MAKTTRIIDQNRGVVLPQVVEIINGDGTWNNLQQASDAIMGLLELANNIETIIGTDSERAVTPAGLAAKTATDAEAKLQTLSARILAPSNLRQGATALGAGALEALFGQHYQIAPAAVSATGVHATMNLGTTVQSITTGITHPDVPRTVTIKGGIAGQTGNVIIHGTNIANAAISDTIALNGVTEVEGIKAFRTVSQIDLPVETHVHAAQVETAVAVGTITGTGNATVTVTASGMTESPKAISVAVTSGDVATAWAQKVKTALAADAAITAMFEVGGSGANIVLTKLLPAANDATLNIALANGTCTGITQDLTSDDTTAGVAYDTVSVGIAKKLGMAHILKINTLLLVKLFDGSADSGTLAVDADELEKNLFALAGTPDGTKLVDLYYLV